MPHFEKMLYDQALLAMTYTEAFQATGEARVSPGLPKRSSHTCIRDMT